MCGAAPAAIRPADKAYVWDLPVRLFHWSLVVLVVAAFITAKVGGNAMVWHGRIGLAIIGLLVFRIVWGFVGSTYARFLQFVRGPGTILAYLRGQWQGQGHNPLGALSVLGLIGILSIQAAAGLFANDDIAFEGPLADLASSDMSDDLTSLHRQGIWLLGGLICLHILATLFYTFVRKNNLIAPMVSGYKPVLDPQAQSARGGGLIAFIVALALSCGAVWAAAGGLLAAPTPPSAQSASTDW